MFARILAMTRYIIYIPIVGSWVAALMILALGGYEIFLTITEIFHMTSGTEIKDIVYTLIAGIDLFLLGTVFYLISLGLYELFINEDAPVPNWLVVHDLDDLKGKLLSVIVVVLTVQFLADVLEWKSGPDILFLGLAISAVVLAVSIFLGNRSKNGSGH